MNSNLLEIRKALHKAFLKIKNITELVESFKVNLISIRHSINENETERFSKNRPHDFIKKASYVYTNILQTS